MKIFIDNDFKCHVSNPDGMYREVETADEEGNDFFAGKCDTFIEGYRFIPFGEYWVRPDGKLFEGEMIAPWKPYSERDRAQREYERETLSDAENALAILLGGAT